MDVIGDGGGSGGSSRGRGVVYRALLVSGRDSGDSGRQRRILCKALKQAYGGHLEVLHDVVRVQRQVINIDMGEKVAGSCAEVGSCLPRR